ncbi:MAG: beta-ketoacyl-[acyl-carrier-protein] synthase II [Ardenticatenia bacterium]|nr:MAG: beta-ketoacyl-[acyl-carrier-protein] synthase II [Ardenticatenia bacterium]
MPVERPAHQRVVVTGLGVVSPLGHSVDLFWDGLLAGRSGVKRIKRFEETDLPTKIGAEITDFDPKDYGLDRREAKRLARCSQFAIVATRQALEDAGLADGVPDPERVALQIGTAYGGFDKVIEGLDILHAKGWRRVPPFALPEALPNMISHHVSQYFGLLGYLGTTVAACASGTQAIIEGAELIRRGVADIVVSGGAEALLVDIAYAGFSAMRGMSTRNDEPERAVRPFDKDRDGFLMGEGAAILILERLDHALARGARIYAEVLGGAASSDAYHIAAPHPEGDGAVRAMRWALENAGLPIEDVDYINAHGTGTPIGDVVETKAIKRLFGERAYQIPISSTKSMIAHSMGAAGAFEAIACVKTIETQTIHPTINHDEPDPECDLDYVPWTPRKANVRYTLSNSFGLGGQNACLVLARYPDNNAE